MAEVKFKRIESSSSINTIPFSDGNFIVTKDGKTFIDYGNDRINPGLNTDIQMSDNSRNAVENKVIKKYVDDMYKKLAGEIVWTNPNPTDTFGAQTITLEKAFSDGYDSYEILFAQSTTNHRLMSTGIIHGSYGTILGYNTNVNYYRPTIDGSYDQTITFEECRPSNDNCIPMYVIFYNKGLF